MVPIWLTAPPNGLSEAERRVLEGFFVAEEVKATADLLRLAPKTIQNELLLARQTMGESKSWMAAIRYVFYVKRQGHEFTETSIVPKIERQIRRLIDDYFEFTESQQVTNTVEPKTESAPVWEREPQSNSREIVSTEAAKRELVAEERFETHLQGLTKFAAIVYEGPIKRRTNRLLLSVAVGLLAITAAWGYLSKGTEVISPVAIKAESLQRITDGLASIHASVSSKGPEAANTKECSDLVVKLCERYWDEMWGKGERALIDDIFKKYQVEIEAGAKWAKDNGRETALRIYGNGHRAFARAKGLYPEWYPQLMEVVKDTEGDKSVYRVRALCGVVFGCLNLGRKADISKSKRDLDEDQSDAIRELDALKDTTADQYDKANAIRHIAMTQNIGEDATLRIETCKRAMAIYEGLGDEEHAKRGIAQCLLSIAQSAGKDLEKERRHVAAYPYVKASSNDYVEKECIDGMADCVTTALKELKDRPQDPTVMRLVREFLFKYGDGLVNDATNQRSLFKLCLDIDAEYSPKLIPVDIQELLEADKIGEWPVDVGYQLTGYVQAHIDLKTDLKNRARQKQYASVIARGAKLSDAQAVALIKRKR